jgi:hypothetical protein
MEWSRDHVLTWAGLRRPVDIDKLKVGPCSVVMNIDAKAFFQDGQDVRTPLLNEKMHLVSVFLSAKGLHVGEPTQILLRHGKMRPDAKVEERVDLNYLKSADL